MERRLGEGALRDGGGSAGDRGRGPGDGVAPARARDEAEGVARRGAAAGVWREKRKERKRQRKGGERRQTTAVFP